MRLYNNIDSLCDSYSIPITESTIGYLQFFSEFIVPGATDVTTVKCFVIDVKTSVETSVTPLNIVVQYLDNNTFRLLIQGFNNLPELFKFRFKIEVSTNSTTVPIVNLFSDLFSFLKCDISYPIIPCLANNQQYSSYGAFLGDISENIVYQSWHTSEPKKYTPVIFLRNVSFNKKTSTIEYKKLNNKPLKSTLKKNYNLICEPVSSNYSEYIMDVFSFGKVNLLGNTFAFDTYTDEIIDEKDCCSLYKVSATAYKENQLRLQCSNNCTVLDPITCDDVSDVETTIPINVYSYNLVVGYTIDITQLILNSTGYDISELGFIDGIDNDCWKIVYNGTNIILELTNDDLSGSCDTLLISYSICNILKVIYLQIIIEEIQCQVSTLNSMLYSSNPPIGWTISGNFTTPVILQYSTDGISWLTAGSFPIGNQIFTNNLPSNNQDFSIRVHAECDNLLISNVLDYTSGGGGVAIDDEYILSMAIVCSQPVPFVCNCEGNLQVSFNILLGLNNGFIRWTGLISNPTTILVGMNLNQIYPINQSISINHISTPNYNDCNPPFGILEIFQFEYSVDGISGWIPFSVIITHF